jgi:hypothetical protein
MWREYNNSKQYTFNVNNLFIPFKYEALFAFS